LIDLSLLQSFSEDRALASEVLFAHRHPQASPDFHVRMVDLWRCADPFVLFEAFRGAGKTTKAEEHLILEGCFGNFNYALLIAETYDKACQRIETLDRECRANEVLLTTFGGKVLARKSIENRIWFARGGMIEAWGWDQELQSFKYHDFRPDLAYLVDIENKERTRDKEAVNDGMRKFHLELMPAMDQTHFRVRFDQTRRAEDCMVVRFAASPDWLYFGMPICSGDPDDPETRSNWEARYPMSMIRAQRDQYRREGMLSEWLLAYMLQAVDPGKKPLKDEMLEEWEASPHYWMPRYALYDPSRTTNEKRTKTKAQSDRAGKVVVSRMGSKLLVHESGGYYWQPNEFIADLFATEEKHSPAKMGIEKNSLDDWLLQPIRLESLRRGVPLPLVALQAPQDRNKQDFILGLQPFGEARDIVLIGGRAAHPQLVAEWCNFPSGQLNVLNALAYALKIFPGAPVYPDFSAANIGETPNLKLGETVYVAWNASPSEVVAVAVVREHRRLTVAADYAIQGATSDAVKTLAFELRATFPRASVQTWMPADTYDQWQRVALLPALRQSKFTPYRGEHVATARGCLSDRMRTQWHNQRLLTIDRKATHTLNSLSAGYAFPVDRGGRTGSEPENGVARLIAEALECMVASLDKIGDQAESGKFPEGANIAYTPGGKPYVTSNPRAR
jgi:hypothetical protein